MPDCIIPKKKNSLVRLKGHGGVSLCFACDLIPQWSDRKGHGGCLPCVIFTALACLSWRKKWDQHLDAHPRLIAERSLHLLHWFSSFLGSSVCIDLTSVIYFGLPQQVLWLALNKPKCKILYLLLPPGKLLHFKNLAWNKCNISLISWEKTSRLNRHSFYIINLKMRPKGS